MIDAGEVERRNMTNVQEPVQEMLLMLTKASRACAGSIRELDEKVDKRTSREFVLGVVADIVRQTDANKENSVREVDKQQHQQQLDKQVAVLEQKLLAASVQISRMNEIMVHQSAAITDLNRRLERVVSEVEGVAERPPPIDEHMVARMDRIERQLDSHRVEVDKRLADKAEQEAVGRLSPLRTEELLRSLSNQVADLRSEVDRKATKDQFHALSEGKVDNNEYINLLASVHEKISMTQLTSAVNNQVKPLVAAVAALEKAVVIQTAAAASSSSSSSSSSASSSSLPVSVQDYMDRKVGPAWETATRQASTLGGVGLDVERVTALVESLLQSHRIGEVTQMGLEKALEQQHDGLLRETGAAVECARAEVLNLCKDRLSALQHQFDGKLAEAFRAVQVAREQIQHAQTRTQQEQQTLASSTRELAEKTSKALQQKADRSELKSEVKKIVARVEEQADSLLAAENSRIAELDAFFDASDRTPQRHDKAVPAERTSPIQPARLSSATAAAAAAPLSARGSRIPSYTPRKSQALEAISALENMDREAEQLRKSLAALKARAEKAEVESAALKAALELKSEALAAAEAKKQTTPPAVNTEWRLALGELGASLRRELSEKMSRSDFQGLLSPDILRIDTAVKEMQREMGAKGESSDLAKLSRSFATLQSRVASELTGALWLFTSRQLLGEDAVVPWDEQIVNAAPASLLWRKGSGMITVRLPGLYRLSLAVFTCLPVQLTLYLNDEPLLVVQPDAAPNPEAFSLTAYINAQAHRDQRYCTRRLRHSAGDVTAVGLEEPLSLPADAVLSVRLQSGGTHAQAMLSLRKL